MCKLLEDVWYSFGLGVVPIRLTRNDRFYYQSTSGRVFSVLIACGFLFYFYFVEFKLWVNEERFHIEKTEHVHTERTNFTKGHQDFFAFTDIGFVDFHSTPDQIHSVITYGVKCDNDHLYYRFNNCKTSCNGNVHLFKTSLFQSEDNTVGIDYWAENYAELNLAHGDGQPCVIGRMELSNLLAEYVLHTFDDTTFGLKFKHKFAILTYSLDGYVMQNQETVMSSNPGSFDKEAIIYKKVKIYRYDRFRRKLVDRSTVYTKSNMRHRSIFVQNNLKSDLTVNSLAISIYLEPTYSEVHIYPESLLIVMSRVGGIITMLGVLTIIIRMYNHRVYARKFGQEVDLKYLNSNAKRIEQVERKLDLLLQLQISSAKEDELIQFIPGFMHKDVRDCLISGKSV